MSERRLTTYEMVQQQFDDDRDQFSDMGAYPPAYPGYPPTTGEWDEGSQDQRYTAPTPPPGNAHGHVLRSAADQGWSAADPELGQKLQLSILSLKT